jgi:hypothetical protein
VRLSIRWIAVSKLPVAMATHNGAGKRGVRHSQEHSILHGRVRLRAAVAFVLSWKWARKAEPLLKQTFNGCSAGPPLPLAARVLGGQAARLPSLGRLHSTPAVCRIGPNESSGRGRRGSAPVAAQMVATTPGISVSPAALMLALWPCLEAALAAQQRQRLKQIAGVAETMMAEENGSPGR